MHNLVVDYRFFYSPLKKFRFIFLHHIFAILNRYSMIFILFEKNFLNKSQPDLINFNGTNIIRYIRCLTIIILICIIVLWGYYILYVYSLCPLC